MKDAPRFLANGIPPADLEDLRAAIGRGEDWCKAWSNRAALHEAQGKRAMSDGFRLTAGEHLVHAALCYHAASQVPSPEARLTEHARLRAVELYDAALPCLRPPGETVKVPVKAKTVDAILRRPEGSGQTPVVVLVAVDGTKESLHAEAEPLLARGMAVLALDGAAAKSTDAVLDWIGRQTDLDSKRVEIRNPGDPAERSRSADLLSQKLGLPKG